MRVLHVISGLNYGGAEWTLVELAARLNPNRFSTGVLSLTTAGPLASELESRGVRVRSLGMQTARVPLSGLARLVSVLRECEPDLVQSWMYHSDLLAALAARVAGGPQVLWNVRGTRRSLGQYGLRTWLVVRACAAVSHWPAGVVANSERGRQDHAGLGYHPKAWYVIRDGFDLAKFKPDPVARRELRRRLGLTESNLLAGMISRYHPFKGHDIMLQALSSMRGLAEHLNLVLVGRGTSRRNEGLAQAVRRYGLEHRVHLMGEQVEIPRWMAALDFLVLPSLRGEGFPNVVGEAMACEVPCVVSDSGDAAVLVGDTGFVIPMGDADGLRRAMAEMISIDRRELGRRARARIAEHFSVHSMVARYEGLYGSLKAGVGASP